MSTITAKLIQLNQERLDFIQYLNTKKINVATTSTFTELVNLLDTTTLFDVTDATVTPETLNKNKILKCEILYINIIKIQSNNYNDNYNYWILIKHI